MGSVIPINCKETLSNEDFYIYLVGLETRVIRLNHIVNVFAGNNFTD